MKNYHAFDLHSHSYTGEFTMFPKRYSLPEHTLVYSRPSKGWFTMDQCPFHIDSVPKETRAMALLLGIA